MAPKAERPTSPAPQSDGVPVKRRRIVRRIRVLKRRRVRKLPQYTSYWPSWYPHIHVIMEEMDTSFGWWEDEEGCSSENQQLSEDQQPSEAQQSSEGQQPSEDPQSSEDRDPSQEESLEDQVPLTDQMPPTDQMPSDSGPGEHPARNSDRLPEIDPSISEAERADRLMVKLNNRQIRRSGNHFLERQILLARAATKLVGKAFELLERTPDEYRPLLKLHTYYTLYCEEHARLFAKNDRYEEYEEGFFRVVKFIPISHDRLRDEEIELDSIPADEYDTVLQADVNLSRYPRRTKLFAVFRGSPTPIVARSWTMGMVPFTFIDDDYFKLTLPRELVLRDTGIEPAGAPESFEFVGITRD